MKEKVKKAGVRCGINKAQDKNLHEVQSTATREAFPLAQDRGLTTGEGRKIPERSRKRTAERKPVPLPHVPKPGTATPGTAKQESPDFPASWHATAGATRPPSEHACGAQRGWCSQRRGARAGSTGAACRGRAGSACCPHSRPARLAPAATALALHRALPG